MMPIRRRDLRVQPRWVAPPQQGPGPNYKFDESTGQVYTERTAPIQCSDDSNWTQRPHCQGIFGLAKEDTTLDEMLPNDEETLIVDRPKGVRTLRDSTIRYIVRNILDITLEVIVNLPHHLIRLLWDAVKEARQISFDTWVMFSKALHRDMPDPNLFHFACALRETMSPLHIYTAPLASNRFDILTSLSITKHFPLRDLVRLSDLPNLAFLEIINPKNGEMTFTVGDRLVREWHLAALNEGAFSVLRFLRLWNCPSLTFQSIAFLHAFPALIMYDIEGCGEGELNDLPLSKQALSKWYFTTKDHSVTLKNACFIRNPQAKFHSLLPDGGAKETDDQGKMRFIPRKEIPAFLGQTAELAPSGSRAVWSTFSSTRFQRWANATGKLLAMSGYLLNDADLGRAGYDLSDQAVFGDSLVNTIPTVSLRLGPDVETNTFPGSLQTGWVRRSLGDETDTNTAEETHHAIEEEGKKSTRRHDAKRKQEGQEVVRSKKVQLNDLLDSFL